jgi:hypothetical protein
MLRFTACDCGIQYLVRIDRDAWMRVWQIRRHYYCAKCKDRQFLPRSSLVSWWMPRESAGGGDQGEAREVGSVTS